MIWSSFDDYETLLQRRHEAEAGAKRARRQIGLLRRYANNTPVAIRIRKSLAARARRLERRRQAVDRELSRRMEAA